MIHYIQQFGMLILFRTLAGIPLRYLLVLLGMGVYFYYNPDQFERLKEYITALWVSR